MHGDEELSILIFCNRVLQCGERPKKWWQRKAHDPAFGIVSFGRASCYQILYEGGFPKKVDITGTDVVDVDVPWTDQYQINDPLFDANCTMKLGGTSVSLAQQFIVGRGPHMFAAATNTSKKPEDNIFNQVNQALQAMPKSRHPVTPKLDPQFLVDSENTTMEGRRLKAKAGLMAQKASGSIKKRIMVRAKSAPSG